MRHLRHLPLQARRARCRSDRARHGGESCATAGPMTRASIFDGSLGLGMRRLSIIDLDGGAQPMSNESGSWVTVFNGEIYNFRELRRELEARGHVFRTTHGHGGHRPWLRGMGIRGSAETQRDVWSGDLGTPERGRSCLRETRSASSRCTTTTTVRACALARRLRASSATARSPARWMMRRSTCSSPSRSFRPRGRRSPESARSRPDTRSLHAGRFLCSTFPFLDPTGDGLPRRSDAGGGAAGADRRGGSQADGRRRARGRSLERGCRLDYHGNDHEQPGGSPGRHIHRRVRGSTRVRRDRARQ